MLIQLYDRTPGEHTHLGNAVLDTVPREGETVVFNNEAKTVHSVTWNLDDMNVTLLLK